MVGEPPRTRATGLLVLGASFAALVASGCAATPAPVVPSPVVAAPALPEVTAPAPLPIAPVVPTAPLSLVVHGSLLGHDGSPMKLAHVHLGDRSVPVDADGAFRFEGKAPGFVSARFTGVDHEPRTLGLFLDGRDQVLEVRLGTYAWEAAGLEKAVLVLHAQEDGAPKGRPEGVVVTRSPRGRFVAKVPAASGDIVYQIRGLVPDRMVSGPESDAFAYDGDGGYFSVLHAHKGPRSVYVDPAALPPAGRPFQVHFADPESRAARVARLHLAAMDRVAAAVGTPANAFPLGETPKPPAQPSWRAEIRSAIAEERDPDVGAALRIAYLVPPPPKSEEASGLARQLLDMIPADASLWRFRPEAALSAVEIAGTTPAREAYLDQVEDALPDPEIAARFLAARVRAASLAGREDELARLYPILRRRFASTAAARSVELYDPARRVRPGHELPDFDLPVLPDPPRTPKGARVTRAALRGKLVLVDFWGVWCIPCRAEVKVLERVFARHKAEGFTIVSVAAFDKLARVQAFRRSVSPMPWAHVVLGDDQDEVLALFETKAFPTGFLVDAGGRILAAGNELRGEALERAVAGALAAPGP